MPGSKVELENRLAMARTVDPSLGDEAVKNMSQDEFIRLIRPKLKAHRGYQSGYQSRPSLASRVGRAGLRNT